MEGLRLGWGLSSTASQFKQPALPEAVFDQKLARLALESGIQEEYRCANSLFQADLHFNVDPNVAGMNFSCSANTCRMWQISGSYSGHCD